MNNSINKLNNLDLTFSTVRSRQLSSFNILPSFANSNLYILASFSNTKFMKDKFHMTACTIFSEKGFKFKTKQDMLVCLKLMKMEKIHLVIINNKPDQSPEINIPSDILDSFTVTRVNYNDFFSYENIKFYFTGNRGDKDFASNNIFFYFEGGNWTKIAGFFTQYDIIVGGGANTKRHILAPAQSRLAIFFACCFEKGAEAITKSFRLGGNKKETRTQIEKYGLIKQLNKNKTNKKYNRDGTLCSNDLNKVSDLNPEGLVEASVEDIDLEEGQSENNLKSDILYSNFEHSSGQYSQRGGSATLKKGYHTKCHNTAQATGVTVRQLGNKDEKTKLISYKSFSQFRAKSTKNDKQVRIVTNPNPVMETQAFSIGDYSHISFLDSLKYVIENSQSDPIKAQLYIENSLIEIFKNRLEDEKYLLTTHAHIFHKLVLDANKTLNILYEKQELKLKFPFLADDLNKLEYLLLAFSLGITYYGRLEWTAVSNVIGKAITYNVYTVRKKSNEVAKKYEIDCDYMSYDKFIKHIGFSSIDFIRLGDYFLQILSQYPHNIFEREFSKQYFYTSEVAKLNINSNYLKEIKEKIIIDPGSLPMLCPPVKWSASQFGGYLENQNKQTSLISSSLIAQQHKTENLETLYNTVNYLQAIKFGINNLLLDYINNGGSYLLELTDNTSDGEQLQREITLKTAQLFSKIPFYLPIYSDWRTRLYTQSFFITYQGGDLSSALLNFWDGEEITVEGKYYLYINGANNHNDSDISKKSFAERIKWVENNYDKIINLDKKLILAAENKFVFTAFCLNMRELHRNPKAIIKSPVFLDATCSGIQHLAGMLKDMELGPKVNLLSSVDTDTPSDIYSELLEPINEAINKCGRENNDIDHAVLALVKLNRKIVKPPIMTKVYNISVYGIAQQLKSKFEKIVSLKTNGAEQSRNKDSISLNLDTTPSIHCTPFDTLDDEDIIYNKTPIEKIVEDIKSGLEKVKWSYGKDLYHAPGIDGRKVILTEKNIFKIAKLINDEIFVIFPSLNEIYSYFLDISKLVVELNIPLTWFTPNGIKITQDYLKTKTTKLAIKLFGVKKTLVLKETLEEKNTLKQINAIIPNIIHSMDASHLMNVINSTVNKGIEPVITVHDCFGTLPNKMGRLQHEVKKEFVLLYTQQNFLATFHDRIIQSIKDNNFEIIKINGVPSHVLNMGKECKIPKVPELGKLDLENVIDSTYMIS